MTDNETRRDGFLIMTRDMHWAWGETEEAAIKAVRGMGDKARKGDRIIYRLPAGATDGYVDQMGAMRWTWADDAPDRNAVGVTIEEPPA